MVLEERTGIALSYLKAKQDKPGATAVPTSKTPVMLVLFSDLLLLCQPKEGLDGSTEPASHVVAEAIDLAHVQLRKWVYVCRCVLLLH